MVGLLTAVWTEHVLVLEAVNVLEVLLGYIGRSSDHIRGLTWSIDKTLF